MTVLEDQVLAVEQWLVTDGETVTWGPSVCVIEMIQLVENNGMRGMCREVKMTVRGICRIRVRSAVSRYRPRPPGLIRHLKQAGERIDCGQSLFETLELSQFTS